MTRRPVLFDLEGEGNKDKTPAPDAGPAAARETEDRAEAARAAAQAERNAERERAQKERTERERAERARRIARERAEQEQAEREKSEREARERAARETAEREARERAARETAEREARERAAREARDKAAQEQAERERSARAQAEREAQARAEQARATREAEERDRAAAERAEKVRSAQQAAERDRLARRERARDEAAKQQAARNGQAREQREQAERERMSREAEDRMTGRAGRTARAPQVFAAEDAPAAASLSPDTAPPVPDLDTGEVPPPQGRAMQTVMALAARRPSRLARVFWSALGALLGLIVTVAIWDFVTGLLTRNALIGGAALILLGLVLVALAIFTLRELAAFGRLRRLDTLHKEADAAIAAHDLTQARGVLDHLLAFYDKRDDTRWGRQNLQDRRDEVFDADALLAMTERELLVPLDAAAVREVEVAARTVAAITALVPITLADLIAALTANLRMIRRIAEIYGGRGGVLGSLRLARSVLTHLVATGVVAVGDDLIASVAGGGMLARLSRRFGEGVVNGALTARVGIAAMEVCRPLPFREARRPSVTALVKRALAGLFGDSSSKSGGKTAD